MAIAQCVAHDANWLFSSIKVMRLHYFNTIIRLYLESKSYHVYNFSPLR